MKNLILIIAASLVSFTASSQLPQEFLDEIEKNDDMFSLQGNGVDFEGDGSLHHYFLSYTHHMNELEGKINEFVLRSESYIKMLGLDVTIEQDVIDSILFFAEGGGLDSEGITISAVDQHLIPKDLGIENIIIHMDDNHVGLYVVML